MTFVVDENLEDTSERSDERRDDRVFFAIADNDGESTYTARQAAGLPTYGEVHPENSAVRARRILAERVNRSTRHFRVRVEYEQFIPPETDDEDPLLDVTKVSYRRVREEVPYARAMWITRLYELKLIDGTTVLSTSPTSHVVYDPPAENDDLYIYPVTNSASDPFDPLPTRKKSSLVMVCTRNEENVDFTVANEWQEAVNIDEFSGANAGTLFLEIDVGDEESRGGVTYRPVSYIFTHRPYQSDGSGGWDDMIQDKGFSFLISGLEPTDPKTNIAIVDPESGQPVTEPKLLDGEGNRLGIWNEQDPEDAPIAVYQVFRPYTNRKTFAELDLGI